MAKIEFEVPGDPKALKRHRTFRRGNFVGTYDPSKSEKADFLQMVRDKAPDVPFAGPIKITVAFEFGRPKSHYGTGRNADKLKPTAGFFHSSRPDLDNLIKFITDALDSVFYRDDAQIAQVVAEKRYGEKPRVIICIENLTRG
ncbi:MAG: RusA family crossover junction endodeoxyribonuclease [Thiotrichaceae bacterium]